MTDNLTVIYVEDGCVGPACTSFYHVLVYWTSAVFIATLGLVVLIFTSIEYIRNPGMKMTALKLFHPLLFGDALIVINFLTYHSMNLSAYAAGGSGRISPGPGCEFSFLLSCLSTAYGNIGLLLIAFAPFKILHDVKHGRTPKSTTLSSKLYVGVFVLSTVTGFMFYLLGSLQSQVGSFKGLYCSLESWDNATGMLSVTAIVATMVTVFTFYFLAFRGLREASTASALQDVQLTLKNPHVEEDDQGIPTLMSSRHVDQIHKAAENILKLGSVMMVSFSIATLSFTITSFLNAASIEVPIEWEVLSGLLIKFRPIVDCIVVYHTPVVYKGRQQPNIGLNVIRTRQRNNRGESGDENSKIKQGTVNASIASLIESQI